MRRAEAILHEVFGHAGFRPGQREIVAAALDGEDVFALMPTGAGKSLLYQLPALAVRGPAVVVSPLISLMRDQIAALVERGVAAAALNSASEPEETAAAMELIATGRIRLLYVAPERLALPDTIDMLRRMRPRLLAVDEAHCVSRWGHDFRPDYARIGECAREIGNPQTIAVTATAAPRTRAEIETMLFRSKPRIFVRSLRRPNIALSFRHKRHALTDVASVVRAHRGEAGIVYCGSRAATESLARALANGGVPALAYHAGLDAATRSAHQDEFLARPDGLMVATIAFGMGIDRKDVRFVCHADLPQSIEAYYQEIGRDGAAAHAIAFVSRADRHFSERGMGTNARERAAMIALARGFDCRWRATLAHLGEDTAPCGACDNCRRRLVWLARPEQAARRIAARLHDMARDRAPWRRPADAEQDESTAGHKEWNEAPPSRALSVAQSRMLARLKAARAEIARRERMAPASIASEEALSLLAQGADCGDSVMIEATVAALGPSARPLADIAAGAPPQT